GGYTLANSTIATVQVAGLQALGDLDGDGLVDFETASIITSDSLASGSQQRHQVGKIFLGANEDFASPSAGWTNTGTPDMVIETERPLYVPTNPPQADTPQPFFFDTVGDINHDGKADFAIADGAGGTKLHVFLGQTMTATPVPVLTPHIDTTHFFTY